MGSKGKLFFLLFYVIFLSFPLVNAWEIDKESTVTEVIDGDSFYVVDDEVRLADVNAPEWDAEGGLEATDALEDLIDGKKVYLDTDQLSGRGPYGRLMAVVYIKHNSTHYKNVNYVLWKIRETVVKDDYTNNEFDPSDWTKFVKYADPPPDPPTPDPPDDPDPPDPPDPTPPPPDPDPPSPPTPPSPTEYDLTIHVEGQGTINHPSGTQTYEENTEITITATPKDYWKIENWNLNGEPQTNQNTFTLILTRARAIK
jgi:hypothetical protein